MILVELQSLLDVFQHNSVPPTAKLVVRINDVEYPVITVLAEDRVVVLPNMDMGIPISK
jgi:hypothetical protein